MTTPKITVTPRMTRVSWLVAALALGSGCADTQDRFIPSTPASSDASTDMSADPDETQTETGDPSPNDTQAGSGAAAASGLAPDNPDSGKQTMPPSATTKVPVTPTTTSGATAQPTTSAGAAAPDLDAGMMPDVDVGMTLDCSAQLALCLGEMQTKIDPCLAQFSTCGDVITTASDSVDAMCSLQLTACLLSGADAAECASKYSDCERMPNP